MNINKKGFSLVELMIVVAIIGVLTAIAIPNFQSFQARSRQSEAKAALTGIYTANMAFHSKWETYAAVFNSIGYVPGGDFIYAAGWDDAVANADNAGGLSGGFALGTATCTDAALNAGPAPGQIYDGACGVAGSYNTEAHCAQTGAECDYRGYAGVGGVLQDTKTSAGPDSVIMVNDFVAVALADLTGAEESADDVASMGDVWSIDEDKNLENNRDQVREAF